MVLQSALGDTKMILNEHSWVLMSWYYDCCIDIASISSLIQSIISSSVGLQPARRSAHTRLCRPVERKIIWFCKSYTGSDGACLVPVERVKGFFIFCHILDILQFSPAELLAGSVGWLGLHRCTGEWGGLAAGATSAVVQFSDSGYWISLLTKASSANTIKIILFPYNLHILHNFDFIWVLQKTLWNYILLRIVLTCISCFFQNLVPVCFHLFESDMIILFSTFLRFLLLLGVLLSLAWKQLILLWQVFL